MSTVTDFSNAPLPFPTEAQDNTQPTTEVEYRGYTLSVHPEWTEYGCRICFVKHPLTVHKALGRTNELAIEAAKRWVDWWLGGCRLS